MHADLDHILITRKQIARRVHDLAAEISNDLEQIDGDGEITLVPVLTGSIIFIADLMRHLPQKLRIELVTVSSYPGKATMSRGAALVEPGAAGGAMSLPEKLDGRHVVIIDDVLDSGSTLKLIQFEIGRRNPASLRTCVLLRKDRPAARSLPCEYVGFDIPDLFIVGYGLDYNNYYRNLPDIGVLKPEAM